MADILTAVKTVSRRAETTEEDLLRPVSTIHPSQDDHAPHFLDKPSKDDTGKGVLRVESPEDALQILRSQPDTDSLEQVLKRLQEATPFGGDFSLTAASPLSAQIMHVLVNTIIPDFWSVLIGDHRAPLRCCLTGVTGINAILARLRMLIKELEQKKSKKAVHLIQVYIEVVDNVLDGNSVISFLFDRLTNTVTNPVTRTFLWKELVKTLASGKVVSAVAQAEDVVNTTSNTSTRCWLSNGSQYASWLGRNVAHLSIGSSDRAFGLEAAAQLLERSLGFGYQLPLLRALDNDLIQHSSKRQDGLHTMRALAEALPGHAQRHFLEHTLRWLSAVLPEIDNSADRDEEEEDQSKMLGATSFLFALMGTKNMLQECLVAFLIDPSLSSTVSLAVHRACIAALFQAAPDEVELVLEKTMSTFGNKVFVQHSAILQQEAIAHIMLISAGYVHRNTPMAVLLAARSSPHMQGVSNRLNATRERVRWLGMVVGTAISSLVDKEGAKMNFGTDEMQTDEAKWWLGLVKTTDTIGKEDDAIYLLGPRGEESTGHQPKRRTLQAQRRELVDGKPVYGPPRPPEMRVQTEVEGEKITELLDDESEEDDGLKPYAKPDSDPEDSDEDATLVNRNKPRAPVYIRDLMAGLQDDKNHDRFELCLQQAALLIRRKSNFGAEVKDHAVELGSILMNLGDVFETEDFDELRLQALIAVLLSDMKQMGPWLSKQAFDGDYSLGQRCIILSAIGLGGRELAGLAKDENLNPKLENASFPTKRLPDRLHAIYSPLTKRLEQAAKNLEHQLMQPMALKAADQSTAHLNAVKVRTFSSRMDVERTKRKPAVNQLAKVLGEMMFFPMLGRFQREISAYGSGSVYNSSFLLTTFLKTLAILLHAAGPATVGLSQITAEFWDLLLSLRVKAAEDATVLEAIIFSLLTLLEANNDKRAIAQDNAKQLMETQEWVELIFERTGGGRLIGEGDEGEAKIRTLAAGVLMKTSEVVQAYQGVLMGSMRGE